MARDTQVKWQSEIKADPEIGGSQHAAAVKDAQLVFKPGNAFIRNAAEANALKQALKTTGAGNDPEIVRFFTRVGKFLAKSGSGGFAAASERHARSLARMHDKMG